MNNKEEAEKPTIEQYLTQFAQEHSYENWPELMNDCHDVVQVEYTKEIIKVILSDFKAALIQAVEKEKEKMLSTMNTLEKDSREYKRREDGILIFDVTIKLINETKPL